MDGPSSGFQRDLTMPLVTIGRLRGGADIEIDDLQVSRLHCAIEVKNDAVFLRDLRSTNGTYVAGRRILSARLDPPPSSASEFPRCALHRRTTPRPPQLLRTPAKFDSVGADVCGMLVPQI